MAVIQATFQSEALHRSVPFQALIPADRPNPSDRPLKTLYLLHGLYGCQDDWLTCANIRMLSQEKNLAVICPAGENGFYVNDDARCSAYSTFIGEELPAFTRRLFPLSHKREDTFIAGLSMGGYGALYNGLRYPETFGAAAGLSSAILFDLKNTQESGVFPSRRCYMESVFGNLEEWETSMYNPEVLVKGLLSDNRELPALFLACGTEDGLLPASRRFRAFLKKEGVPCAYEEFPGGHDWQFWDTAIRYVAEWLPL